MSWTEARIEQLRSLWGQGLTASQIAEQLGAVSRNAVIGKAHRLGLQSRPSPVKGTEGDEPVIEDAPVASSPAEDAEPTELADVAEAVSPPAEEVATPSVSRVPLLPQETRYTPPPSALTGAQIGSIGPGGFLRQGPAEQLPPAQPAPPRRLVPAKPNADMADKTGLLDLNERICKWPIGHPGEPDFHFCGQSVNPGFPYCVGHCGHAYQAQMPRSGRKPPPPLPFGGARAR